MKEKQCPSCMMVINKDATKCPHCRKKLGLAWPFKIFIVLAILWAIGYSSSLSVNQTTASSAPSVEGNTMHKMEETSMSVIHLM
jgi:hypothetical protein